MNPLYAYMTAFGNISSEQLNKNFEVEGYESKYKQSESWLDKDNSVAKMNELRIKNGLKPLEV